jgi:DNA helicase II / ATP-dependent DNA helicase PcrA
MRSMSILSPRPVALRERPRSLIDVELDVTQRAAAERPAGGAMLVLGEAGHGKTTVALHRLAYLYRTAGERFRAVVLVPHVGLEALLQPLVTHLGADVSVQCYERWARRQARRAFGDIPRRESASSSSGIMRVKRAAALSELLRELARLPPGRIDDDEDAPPPATKAHAHRGDLQHLFGDAVRMRRLVHAAGISESAIAEVLEHTHVQFLERSETAYAHVDAERLVSVDAQSLDAGTPDENAASIDSEDYAVLFELDRLRALHNGLRPTRPRRYDCIVLDEAQEFAPLELTLIGRSLARGATLVVAGDADQQTDPAAGFSGWRASMRALKATNYETVRLDIGYRCPPPVAAFARALRSGQHAPVVFAGTGATPSGHGAPREPLAVSLLRFTEPGGLADWLVAEVAQLEEHDPSASVCIVARSRESARQIALALRGRVPCKLVLDAEFMFHRGADVTALDQVKGLEFDYVIVPDASANAYPATPEARRALYVAATRARYQLALASTSSPSPLLDARGYA